MLKTHTNPFHRPLAS